MREIPEDRERFCFNCSEPGEEPNQTHQVPVGVEVFSGGRGCFSPHARIEWHWECQECGEVQI